MKSHAFGFLCLFALACAFTAFAHSPNVSTCRLSLRDERIEVIAEWDLFTLTEVTPTEIATTSPEELYSIHRALIRRIENETTLVGDDVTIPLKIRGFPTPDELRASAAELSAAGFSHGHLARLRLEATQKVTAVGKLSLTPPRALGDLIVTFVQPATRYLSAGDSALFDVLVYPKAESFQFEAREILLGGLPVAIALIGAILWVWKRAFRKEASV